MTDPSAAIARAHALADAIRDLHHEGESESRFYVLEHLAADAAAISHYLAALAAPEPDDHA